MVLQLLHRRSLFQTAVVIRWPARSPVIAAVTKETDRRSTGGKCEEEREDLKLTRKDDKESHEEGKRGSIPDRTVVKKNDEASSSYHVRTASPAVSNAVML